MPKDELRAGDGAVKAVSWDSDGAHLSACTKIIRANQRGTGCRLTAAEVRAMHFAEQDGEWFTELQESMTKGRSHEG